MVPAPPRPAPAPLLVGLPTRLPLPAAGPAFDDQADLDLSSPPADGPSAPPSAPAALADGPSAPPPAQAARPDEPPDRPPDTGAWAGVFAQALAEALAGSRPARQIAPWTTEQARRRIRQLGPLLQDGPRPVVRRVLTSAPRRDVVEMTVVIGVGPRTRAI
ncbi:MAG TPA: Rv3235 family protein, partial [Streptosporangiaceae bacterium]|nr:Rv3235 family protein [Streptosporangiaceae bacterium]